MKLYIKLASLLLSLGAVTGQTLPLGPQPLPTVETTSTGGQSPTVTAEMKWDGVSGRTYFVQKSTNFESWSYVIMGTPEVPIYHFSGIGAELTFPIPSPGDGTHYRLAYLDVPNYDVMTADSDNDGITDQDEIDAGTDALNGAIYPIGGVSPLEVTLVPVNDTTGISGWEMKWKSSPETNYTIQRANDLSNWVSISQTILGDGSVKSYLIPLNEIAGWHYRLAYTQVDNSVSADTDGDGLSDLWEELNQLNPYSRDTNGNGIDDGDEVNEQAGVSQASVYQSFESGSSDNLLPDPYPHLERGVIMFHKESKGSQRGKSAAFRQFYEGQLPQKPKYYLKKFSEVTVDYSHGLEGLIGSPFGIGTISEKFDRIKNEKEVEYTGDGEAMRFVSASYVSDVKKETITESGGYDDPPNEQDEDDEIETVTSKVDLSEEYTMAMVKSDVEYDIAKNPWVKTVVNHAPLENLAGVQEVDLYRNESYVSFINKIKMFWAPGTPEEKKYPVLFLQGYTPQGTPYAENENATELIGPEGEIKVLGKWDGKGAFSQTFVIDPLPGKNGDYRANSLALDLAPEVLAVNSDFDEGRIDPATGYAIPDCDDVPGVDRKTGAGNGELRIDTEREHLDGLYANDERVTDEMHKGWFGVNPKRLGDDFWDGATVTIRKIDKIDKDTGRKESGQVRFYAKWGDPKLSNYYGIIPYDLQTLAPNNLVRSGVNGKPGEGVYGSSSTIPDNAEFWMEGVRPGKITLEWRYKKGNTDVKYEQTFLVCTEQSKAKWQEQLTYMIRLQTDDDPEGTSLIFGAGYQYGGQEDVSASPTAAGYASNVDRASEYYDFYEQCWNQNNSLSWSGLAKVVGAQVISGISDSQWGIVGQLGFVNVSGWLAGYDLADIKDFQLELFKGGEAIFKDVGWQHHAYLASGICALEFIHGNQGPAPAPDLSEDVLEGWKLIDDGDATGDASKILNGSIRIADYEQNTVIVKTYTNLDVIGGGGLVNAMSYLAVNPVQGGDHFRDVAGLGAQLSNTGQRWEWVTAGLPGFGHAGKKGVLKAWDSWTQAQKDGFTNEDLRVGARRFSVPWILTTVDAPYLPNLDVQVWDHLDQPGKQ